jgi:hypothetical protein
MNAMLIPILLICAAIIVVAFILWMVFFSQSGRQALREQHREERSGRRHGS